MSVEHVPLIVAVLTFLLAGFVKGVIGLGLPTVSMGLLSLVMAPAKAASLHKNGRKLTRVYSARSERLASA